MKTSMGRYLRQAAIVVALTVLTQVGGLVWIASRWLRRPVLGFVVPVRDGVGRGSGGGPADRAGGAAVLG